MPPGKLLPLKGYRLAVAGSAAVAAMCLVIAAPIVRVVAWWPPRFAPRLSLAHEIPDGPWGSPWDALTRPPSTYQVEALGGLASAIAHLALGCLIIAGLSLALHAIGRLVAQWRALTIRCALGAQLRDLAGLVAADLAVASLAGSLAGVLAGVAGVGAMLAWWPALLSHPGTGRPVAIATLVALAAPSALVLAVTAPLLAYLQRRVRTVSDQAGEHATERGGLLLAQNALAVLQLAGLLVVAYGGALLVRGSSLFDAERPVPYSDSSTIAPLTFSGAGGVAARAAAYARILDTGRRGDTPLVAVASPGVWLGFGKRAPLLAFCPGCVGAGYYHVINGTSARVSTVSPGALALMGIRIVHGREFTPGDSLGARRVVVLSDVAAGALYPYANPVGQDVHLSLLPGGDYRVVGIARSPAPPGLGAGGGALPMAYFSILQLPPERAEVVARAGARTILARAAWPGARSSVPPALALGRSRPLAGELREAAAPLAWFGAVAAALGLSALAVALYALMVVMGQTVESRRREIAVRLALGAQAAHIWRWVGLRALALTIAGAGAGAGAARWVGVLLRARVRGFETDDIGLLLLLTAGFGALALLASLLPARRAMRVEPAAAWSEIR